MELKRAKEVQADTISGLRKRTRKLEDRLFALGEMENAPCFCCGYNGPGYYNMEQHPCAERHHRLREGVVKS